MCKIPGMGAVAGMIWYLGTAAAESLLNHQCSSSTRTATTGARPAMLWPGIWNTRPIRCGCFAKPARIDEWVHSTTRRRSSDS